eukprot:CAMPEP_0180555470 /NCGR_PEP_ID=MMETSP1036_2-20121128/75436_1 /TAXON_ID=632150 /ORGANISM="Azadinium spinosum, Strain 3D9" /LENGTH=73 /DNA_ID=CAMNT_0022571273 /DNA_START=498 /DNA_END=717 /DNA_ORIENTATION=+
MKTALCAPELVPPKMVQVTPLSVVEELDFHQQLFRPAGTHNEACIDLALREVDSIQIACHSGPVGYLIPICTT